MTPDSKAYDKLVNIIKSLEAESAILEQLPPLLKQKENRTILKRLFNGDIAACMDYVQAHAVLKYKVDLNLVVKEEHSYELISENKPTKQYVDDMIRHSLDKFTRTPDNDYSEIEHIYYNIVRQWSLPPMTSLLQ